MRPVSSLLALLFVTLAATSANADVAPPNGQKQVNYTFTLKGLATAPDQAVFAFPCGGSNGAPHDEHRLLEENKSTTVGRRGGACTLYTISKASYDEWAKTYTPADGNTDPALTALAGRAKKCTGAPTPSFELKTADTRSSIDEVLEVKTLNAGDCVVASTNPPRNPESTTTPADPASPTSPTSSSASDTSATNDGGGCSVGGAAGSTGPWLLALAVPALLVLSSRRRKKQS